MPVAPVGDAVPIAVAAAPEVGASVANPSTEICSRVGSRLQEVQALEFQDRSSRAAGAVRAAGVRRDLKIEKRNVHAERVELAAIPKSHHRSAVQL